MPLARATGLLKSLASFTQPTTAQGSTGNFTASQTPVAGLQLIPCMDAPESMLSVSSTEKKAADLIEANRLRHVLLDRYYAQVPTAAGDGWRVTIDGVLYDLLGGEADSQRTQTRLRLQLVIL